MQVGKDAPSPMHWVREAARLKVIS